MTPGCFPRRERILQTLETWKSAGQLEGVERPVWTLLGELSSYRPFLADSLLPGQVLRAEAKRSHDKSKMALREPCPGRVVDDFGGAFAMGGLGGVIFYFFKGFYNAPSRERFRGAMSAIKFRAPILGGSFGMWGGLFSAIDCALLGLRQEDSPINAVLSGFMTGTILASRSGIQVAWRNGMAGAVILSIIEGVNIGYTNMALKQQSMMMNAMTKIQEERMRRQAAGLPDFTMEEMNQMMMKSVEGEPGFFKKMFAGSPSS